MRTLLVTGGNRGIGLAIVKGLAEDPENIVLLGCRDIVNGKKIAGKISDKVHAVPLELDDRYILDEQIAQLQSQYPKIDVLVNNAGMLAKGNFLECDPEDVETTMRVNTLAPYQLMKALVPEMIKNGYGRVVNISSGWGAFSEGLNGPFSYSVSKAALNALTLSASQSVPNHVKINAMSPGWVRTDMGGMNAPRSADKGAETAIWLANLPPDGPNGGFFRDMKFIGW